MPREGHGAGGRGRGVAMGRVALIAVANVAVVLVLLALLEGGASLLYLAHEIVTTPGVPEHEHNHVEHDPLLGWVNRPAVHLPDAYGPGAGIRTNTQRFRAAYDYTPDVPPGRMRVICSGDSFTFGYGVDDSQAWCERLAAVDARLETVNMGLGGYGVDQAFLWYRRDGTQLDHDVHIFAFLTDDFRRMRHGRFMGYGKPLLALEHDTLVVVNAPVRPTSWLTRRQARHAHSVERLRLVRLARRLLGLDGAARAAASAERIAAEDARVRAVTARIFADLKAANDARGSRLVLVYFPGRFDYTPNHATTEWRTYVAAEASRQGIALIDMVEEIRAVPPAEIDGLYAPNAHFSVAGNEWAAQVLHRRMSPLLDSIAQSRQPGAAARPAAQKMFSPSPSE